MSKQLCYRLVSVVDRDAISNSGNIAVSAMFRVMANLLHYLASLPVVGCFTLAWLHNPIMTSYPQKWSKILLISRGDLTSNELLEQTIHCMGYKFEKYDMADIFPFSKLRHCCDITKLHHIRRPSVSKEFNPDILPGYFDWHKFKEHNGNDYSDLDSFLSRTTKPVMWSLTVEKYDSFHISNLLARYSEMLTSVNFGRIDSASFMTGKKNGFFRFDKHKDPLADETRRNLNRMLSCHDDLTLIFSIRTFAPSIRLAQLTAAILAGSCLCGGSYDIHTDSANLAQAINAVQSCKLLVPTISLKTDCSETKKLYENLKILLNTASPEELTGFFRMPIASQSFRPRTLVCDSNPPAWPEDKILPLGYEVVDHV